MKKLLSLALVCLLTISICTAYADNDLHPMHGKLPYLDIKETQSITDNPYAGLYNTAYQSNIKFHEKASEFYANIDVLLTFENQNLAFVYDALDNQFVFEEDFFVKDEKLMSEDLFALEDLLNHFNLLYAELQNRGLVAEGIQVALPKNLVDADRLASGDTGPLSKMDDTTLYNNFVFTLYLLDEKDFIEDDTARAMLGHIQVK